MLLKKLLLIGGGVVVGSTALASAIAIPISQSQLNSSSAEVPTDPNANNQQNDQSGNNSQNEENNNPQVPDTDNNGNSGESTNPDTKPEVDDSNLIKEVKLPSNGEVFFKNLKNSDKNTTNFFSYQVYNKTIKTDSELNNKLKTWFEENKNDPTFNDLYFLDTRIIAGLAEKNLGYNYEPITYVDNSAKIITENLSNKNSDSSTFNKVYSFNVTLTPASGYGWTDGGREGKIFTVYAAYGS